MTGCAGLRGLLAESATLWAVGGGEEVVVRWLREEARGGSGRPQQEVRGLPAKAAKLWAAGGGEEAVVLWLCEGAHGGGGPHQQ